MSRPLGSKNSTYTPRKPKTPRREALYILREMIDDFEENNTKTNFTRIVGTLNFVKELEPFED